MILSRIFGRRRSRREVSSGKQEPGPTIITLPPTTYRTKIWPNTEREQTFCVFDFDAGWDRVTPVLGDPLALRALNAGMTNWCIQRKSIWDPEAGPWFYSHCDYWASRADEKFKAAGLDEVLDQWCTDQGCPDWRDDPVASEDWTETHGQDIADKHGELSRDFYPQPTTPDWYRCWGAGFFLSAWSGVIGQLLFPNLVWHVALGKKSSCAIGMGISAMLCMDILWGKEHAADIWPAISDGSCITLLDGIEHHEKSYETPAKLPGGNVAIPEQGSGQPQALALGTEATT